MSTTKNLLVELFVEELPPRALKGLGEAFASRLFEGLKAQGLATQHSAVTAYATPRRLAAQVSAVRAQGDDMPERRKLMPVAVAFDASGQLTPAARKKLAAMGIEASHDVQRAFEGKSEFAYVDTIVKGRTLTQGLQAALDDTIAKLPIPKVMTYQLADGWSNVQFVRPAHGLIALHGADVIPVRALGLDAGRDTQGHRFEASVEPIRIQDADHYARQLDEQGAVIASFAQRRADIVRQLQHAAGALDLQAIDDDALLDEVTALVERPNVLLCQFEPQFLAVPPECLILWDPLESTCRHASLSIL